jgi:hypothetical protein
VTVWCDQATIDRYSRIIANNQKLTGYCENKKCRTDRDWSVTLETQVAGTGLAGDKWYKWFKVCDVCGNTKKLEECKR